MGLEKDILRALRNRSQSFDELQKTFPQTTLSTTLIEMEEKGFVENIRGTWNITTRGRNQISGSKAILYGAIVIPAIIFFLLAGTFYMGYSQAADENNQLLQKKTLKNSELTDIEAEKSTAQAEYNSLFSQLQDAQDQTSQLTTLQEEKTADLHALRETLEYYVCLETCTPDAFVTVDNAYVQRKVEDITAGLTTLQEKQRAIYEFVRDDIADDEYHFRTGRLDLWEYPEEILRRGKGHTEDKFLLLLTMFRIAGTPAHHVKFIAGEVDGNDNWVWVEVYDGLEWWVLDPFEGYVFTSNPRDEFYGEHDVIILWWFNDAGLHRG
jgi:hypothetical protein